jgi:hypothetical protein
MPLLTISESAIESGFSVELLEALMKRCPKPGDDRVLAAKRMDDTIYIDDRELQGYLIYLREPWPLPAKGKRPRIPDPIARDVREECHHACAICGDMNNGELAHIDAVADTLNNSPDNLILLCPNHHTEYDYGHRPSTNVKREVVLAAKEIKRASRRRMLRFEGNVAGTLRVVLRQVSTLQSTLQAEPDAQLREAYVTELQALIEALPSISHSAQEAASRDAEFAVEQSALVELAPKLVAATQGAALDPRGTQATASSVVSLSRSIVHLDEVSCPHCDGRGTTGLMGRLCAYCGGDQVVTEAAAARYAPDSIDEVPCPHCEGRGTIGLMSTVCRYCGGDTVVSQARADRYDPDTIDEVPCPRCEGRGTIGLASTVCRLCRGDTVVSSATASEFLASRGIDPE